MDRVKLGRALGYGTRHAVKTLASVAEAASAPDPRGARVPQANRQPVATATAAPVRDAGKARAASSGNTRRAVWAPLATFSGALWLRVTGCFFALIALTMASGAWRMRGALRPGTDPLSQHHLWMFFGFAALFGYFAVSSFVRANLRERRATAKR